jgi:hypothetical protein
MRTNNRWILVIGMIFVCGFLLRPGRAFAQRPQVPGHPIGKVTTQGNLVVLELDEGAVAPANLFDLAKRTLRFTPSGSGFRVENMAGQWDAEFGTRLKGPDVALGNFSFPFSGKSWNSFSVGQTGTISFGEAPAGTEPVTVGRGGTRGGWPQVGRFEELWIAASRLINTGPFISVFQKPRLTGPFYAKELSDRVVITWDLTEPSGGIFDYTWVQTVNRFQAVLRRDGSIDLSYDQIRAQDAIVGVYPVVPLGRAQSLASLPDAADPAVPAHMDLRSVKASIVDGRFLRITIETRGPVLPPGDPNLAGVSYQIYFDVDKPFATEVDRSEADLVWAIRGTAPQGGGGGGTAAPLSYAVSGPGVFGEAKISGNTISVTGTLPAALKKPSELALYAESMGPGNPSATADRVMPRAVKISGLRSPEVDFSAMTGGAGPLPIVFESFHHVGLPRAVDMSCTVIRALGDKFDFFVWYSDFPVDNQEAGSPSTGPRGGGTAGLVTGTGQRNGRPDEYGSAGRLQWMYAQPVWIGSNQGQERSPDGKMTGYNYAMSQIPHELAHRWSANATAKVGDETIPLGPTHWDRGLHAPAAFPYRRIVEASLMGGGYWQDNFDGTFSQLDDNFYVPATGWSPLELYLMGLAPASEVPDFFLLRNLKPAGKDGRGYPTFQADRVKITIKDVIASLGPRQPDFEHSQKAFNTGIVALVLPGASPSRALTDRLNAIREAYIEFWATTTGHRSVMDVSVK